MSGAAVLFEIAFFAVVPVSLGLTLIITARQAMMSFAALSLPPSDRRPTTDVTPDDALPRVAVIVPAHDEEAVIAEGLRALINSDYPRDLLQIVVVDDRSTDATGSIIDQLACDHPILRALHRPADAPPGKPAALRDAIAAAAEADVFVFFDADYLPAPSLFRELVAPFANAEVGATMGRVVPINSDVNVLTRLIDLERRAGYVVDQQMRERMQLLPQFGGTAGAVRADALAAVGGWRVGVMTEDTYLTYALFIAGYEVVYLHHAACYEESPETWPARYRQVRRWAYGHNECLLEFFIKVLRAPRRRPLQRLDAALVLLFYVYPALSLAAMPLAILAPAVIGAHPLWMLLPIAPLLCGFGNLAPFFQIAVAARQDRQPHVLAILPLLPVSSVLNMLAASHGAAQMIANRLLRRRAVWDKTSRFRPPDARALVQTPLEPRAPRVRHWPG